MSLFDIETRGLKLIRVADPGVPNRERILLEAEGPVDLVNYVILDAHAAGPDQFEDINNNVFWFPRQLVQAGDIVRLYSHVGEPNITNAAYGKRPARFHNLFWGKREPVWKGRSNSVVLLVVSSWTARAVR